MSEKSQKALQKQKRMFVSIIFVVVFLSIGIGYMLVGDSSYSQSALARKPIDLPADKMNPQDIWMNRLESQNVLFDQKLKYLEEVILETKKQEQESEQENRQLKQEITRLRSELVAIKESPAHPMPSDPLFGPPPAPCCPSLIEFVIEEREQRIGNVNFAVPAGTTVKALLVSSVDADCGVYSINDPIPIKLRILDDGHLPKCIDVRLKGGIIIGSAYGNLSSERVYMRIERLTQVNRDGDFVETEVAGYVTGEDGKYGVRGTVVDKSTKIIANAAISGIFSEGGQILQAAVGRFRIDNYLSTNQAVNDPFIPGACNGACNAFDMLADYYIRRAEQIEPVIQVAAGRIVDVTFTHGAEIGELHMKDKIREVRDRARCCR